jgi:two-component system chemotaxis response regulator CheY
MEQEGKATILIVDDDKFLLDMYSMKFKTLGYQVSAIANSQEALVKLREGISPDVILLDVIMPNMDGIELLENIRKENLTPSSTIIMLSNETDPDKIDKAKSFGIAGYIVKATTIPSEVVEKVGKILDENKKQ